MHVELALVESRPKLTGTDRRGVQNVNNAKIRNRRVLTTVGAHSGAEGR